MKLSQIILVLTFIKFIGCVPLPLLFNDDDIETHDYESWKMKLHELRKSATNLSEQRSFIEANMMDNGVIIKYRQLFDEFVGLFGRDYNGENEREKRFLIFLVSFPTVKRI